VKNSPMDFEIGQPVWVHIEGSLRPWEGTVAAQDEQWLTVKGRDGQGPLTLRFGYDAEEGFWFDEDESGNWTSIYTNPPKERPRTA